MGYNEMNDEMKAFVDAHIENCEKILLMRDASRIEVEELPVEEIEIKAVPETIPVIDVEVLHVEHIEISAA